MSNHNKLAKRDALDQIINWQCVIALFAALIAGGWETANRLMAGKAVEPVAGGMAAFLLTWVAMTCYILATRLFKRQATDKSRLSDTPRIPGDSVDLHPCLTSIPRHPPKLRSGRKM
jgi:TRAP-type C4-dicarboxylate transport system permease small subunit